MNAGLSSHAALLAASSTTTSFGLWLVGIGALVVVSATFLSLPSRGTGGLTFGSPERARSERIQHAIQTVALAFVASGSVVVAVAELPALWLLVLSLAVFVAGVWLISAWTQRRVWITQRQEARRAAAADNAEDFPMMRWRADCADHCVRWRWALRHPFNGQTWPDDFKRRHPRPGS